MKINIMAKKLTKHGNDLALVIDKPILDSLKIGVKTELELIVKDGSLIIRSINNKRESDQNGVEDIAKEIMEKYEDVFKKLSKT